MGKLMEAVAVFKSIQIPRFYGNFSESPAVLVGFSDASEDAYACCIYIVGLDVSGNSTSLVVSKTRVSPLKIQTIPRLELLGALILSPVMKRVWDELKKVLKIDEVFCLTDAEVVLNWVQRKDKMYKQFVQNRVVEILLVPCTWD